MYRSTSTVCNVQVYFLFLLINIFIFHIDIVYECIVLRCIVENKLTYHRVHYLLTMTQKNKILNLNVTAVRNLLASIILPLGETCGVVYDKFRHFILWRVRVGVRRREHCDLREVMSNAIYKP